jgi:hypothetical protein
MSEEIVVLSGGDGAEAADESARALRGKIARLPKSIREKLNRRLDDGEPLSTLVDWLNVLPAVKKVLTTHFGGVAINHQNISNWRASGFQRWVKKQEFVAELKVLSEEATDFYASAGSTLARGTASIAAAKILKMLHTIRPEDCTPTELVKIAFAITGLVQAEQNNERLKNEKTRVYQGNERLVLSWDKHLRDCVATAQRVLNDTLAKEIQDADIDNSEKIELLGHHLFGQKWVGREVTAHL